MEKTYTPDPVSGFKPRQNDIALPITNNTPQIDHTDDQAILAACREELVKLLPTVTGTAKLAVIRELLNRIEGKPMQRIDHRVAAVEQKLITVEFV